MLKCIAGRRPRRLSIFLAFSFLLFLWPMPSKGQESRSGSALSPAAEPSWAAAQRAREDRDYAAAEKKYREVIHLAPRFAEAYMNLGLVYELENRRQDAITLFEKAVRLKPGLVGAQFFLGVDYCKLGAAPKAIPHLEAAVRTRPDLPDAWSWLATAHEMAAQFPAQVRTLEAGLHSNPQSVDLLYLLGHAYEQLGKDAVDRLQQNQPNSTYVEQLLAENYATSGYASTALLHFQNALNESPDRLGLHLEIGEVFLHAGNLKRAQEEIAAELHLHPHNLRALVRQGEVKLLSGDVPGALVDWSHAMTVDRTRTETILGLREFGFGDTSQEKLSDDSRSQLAALRGQVESQSGPAGGLALSFLDTQAGGPPSEGGSSKTTQPATGKSPEACTANQIDEWLKEDRLEPVARCSSRPSIFNLPSQLRLEVGRALFETSRPEQALKVLDSPPPGNLDSPQALYWKARCYKRLALGTYLRLFQLNPESYRAHEILGDLHLARGEEAKAVEEFQKALAERPTLPNLHYQIGHLQWKGYKVQEARQEFLAELDLNPNHTGTLFDLGNTYLYERQPEKALEYLKKVSVLDPNYPDVHEFLGKAYNQMRKYAQAETELELAAAEDKDGRVHYQLGKVYQALGRIADAEREFALSSKLKSESAQKNEVRVQRIAAAEAALKQP
jgi:tetratricopeptide (TPR) repeat protein